MSQEILDERLSRRTALRMAGVSSAVVVGGLAIAPARSMPLSPVLGRWSVRSAALQDPPEGPFTQAELPYGLADLEPAISGATMELHFGSLHVNYITALNTLVEGQDDLAGMKVDDIVANLGEVPEDEVTNAAGVVRSRRAFVQFNAGGHYNHSIFWRMMSPDGGGEPTGDVADLIDDAFGDFASFQDEFRIAGVGNTGSGWVWLVSNDGELSITTTQKQDNPLMDDTGFPILGVDVWEHAYVLQYGGARADYITAWWNVVDWDYVNERLAAATS